MVVSYIIGGHEKVQAALVGGIKLRARVFIVAAGSFISAKITITRPKKAACTLILCQKNNTKCATKENCIIFATYNKEQIKHWFTLK